MNLWKQHAQLIRLGERADGAIDVCEFYHSPLSEIRLVALIDFDDPATKAFFSLINFDTKQGMSNLSSFNQCFRVWLTEKKRNPWACANEVNDLFGMRHANDGWTKLNNLFYYMARTTLSETVDATDVLFSPDDEIQEGSDFFSVGLAVADKGLLSNVAIIDCRAVASAFERVLPLMQDVIDEQAARWNRLSHLGRSSDEYLSEDKHQRAKPSYVIIEKNGRFFMDAPFVNQDDDTLSSVDWGRATFDEDEMATMQSVLALATRSQGNRLKGRFLEEVLGL
jgi:hypothetical protein